MKSIVIAALLAQVSSTPGAAPLSSTGRWFVDYQPAACLLSRDFGSGAAATTVGFRPSALGDTVDIVLMVSGATGSDRKGAARIVLQPSGFAANTYLDIVTVPDRNSTITTIHADKNIAEKLAGSTGLAITSLAGPNMTVAMAGAKKAFGSLERCQADLLKSWGVDPGEPGKIAVAPVDTSTARWVGYDDYPAEALAYQQQGTTTLILAIDQSGRVARCKVARSSGSPSLDDASCKTAMRHGRYKPAIGMDGKPMPAHTLRTVSWNMRG